MHQIVYTFFKIICVNRVESLNDPFYCSYLEQTVVHCVQNLNKFLKGLSKFSFNQHLGIWNHAVSHYYSCKLYIHQQFHSLSRRAGWGQGHYYRVVHKQHSCESSIMFYQTISVFKVRVYFW